MVCETLCQSSNNYKNKTESTYIYVYFISTESAYLPLILLNFSMVKVRQPHPGMLEIINSEPWTKSQSIISYSKKGPFQISFELNKIITASQSSVQAPLQHWGRDAERPFSEGPG